MSLFEELTKLNVKRRALAIQSAILDHPYGDYMHVQLKAMPVKDAFAGGERIQGNALNAHNETAIVLYVNDQFDKDRTDPYGSDGIRIICVDDNVYNPWFPDELKVFYTFPFNSADEYASSLLARFFVLQPADGKFPKQQAGRNEQTLMCHEQLYFVAADVRPNELEAGDYVLARSLKVKDAVLCQLDKYVIDDDVDGVTEHDSVANAISSSNAGSLMKLVDRLKMVLKNVSGEEATTPERFTLWLERHGATARWGMSGFPYDLVPLKKKT